MEAFPFFEIFVWILTALILGGLFAFFFRFTKKSDQLWNRDKKLRLTQAILDYSPSCIYVKDVEGKYLLVNKYALVLFNFRKEEDVIGKTDEELFSIESSRKALASDRKVLQDGTTIQEEYKTASKYGARNLFLVKTPLKNSKGHIFGLCGIATDITAQKKAQSQLNTYLEKLEGITTELIEARIISEQANKIKDSFLANMSHELRTPLNGILGNITLLFQTALDEKQQKYAERIHLCAKILLDLIQSVLDFSKITAGQLKIVTEKCDLTILLNECVSICRVLADQKHLDFRTHMSESLPKIKVDPLHFKEVIMNLLNNAIKFTENGFIELNQTVLSKTTDTLLIRIEIKDSGIGIPKEKMKFLFEKFWQADTSTTRKYGGTGLGLAISKELVNLMGGTIKAESKEGIGTTFTIEIPFFIAYES